MAIGVNFVIPIDRPNGMLMECSKQSKSNLVLSTVFFLSVNYFGDRNTALEPVPKKQTVHTTVAILSTIETQIAIAPRIE